MSKMYGKRRVVLSAKSTRLGNRLVVVCGSDEASANRPGSKAGNYQPLGYWYQEGGLFYAELKSAEKRLGGFPTKQGLREYVMEYWLTARRAQEAK